MTTPTITTSHGTTIDVKETEHGTIVVLGNPAAPEDMRSIEAGRIINGGFQPAPFSFGAFRPEVLRVIADLIEGAK